MELKEIYKIIDDTFKDMKEHCFKNSDEMDMLNELAVFSFCIALKKDLEEADKNEH